MSRPRRVDPRLYLLILASLACLLGNNAPPGGPGPIGGGVEQPDPGEIALVCPAFDPATSPLPSTDLTPSDTAEAGALVGSFAVSRLGEATYSIPLAVPPGVAGMEPSLAIAYNSSASEGPLGVGFALAGFSAISRCPANLAQDGFVRAVRYDKGDHFCLDGERLAMVGQAFALDGSGTREYRTIPDTFARIIAHYGPGLLLDRGPESFEVFTRSGRIVEYGSLDSARVMGTGGGIGSWWVSRERDRRGNAIAYTYDNDKDGDGHTVEIVPRYIDYAQRDDQEAARRVRFVTTERAAPSTFFSGGMKLRRSKLIARVEMMTEPGDVVVRSYRLDYEPSAGTGRPVLKAARECAGATSVCKPETRFGWSSHGETGMLPRPALATGSWPISPYAPWVPADVNGDGLPDLVVAWWDATTLKKGISVALNRGGSWGAWSTWATYSSWDDTPTALQPFDYDQDGLTDLVFADEFYNTTAADSGTTTVRIDVRVLRSRPGGGFEVLNTGIPLQSQYRLGDLDGDGVADLLLCAQGSWRAHFWSPVGPGFDSTPTPIPPLEGTDCGAISDHKLRIVDLDGDGKPEIVAPAPAFYDEPLGDADVVWHADGSIDCGGEPCRYIAVGWTGSAWALATTSLPVRTTPVTGGPMGDITGSALEVLSEGKRTMRESVFADVNGDGLPDAVSGSFSGGRPRTFLNTGAGFTTAGVESLTGALPAEDSPEDRFLTYAQILDDDGDGRADILVPMAHRCGDPEDSSACWVIWRSRGDGTFSIRETGIPFWESKSFAAAQNVRVLDIDGDGRHDVLALENLAYAFSPYKSGGPQDLLTSITDGMRPLDPGDPGFIPTVKIDYTTLIDRTVTQGIPKSSLAYDDQTYIARADPANGCSYPRACVVGPERVVRRYWVNNGNNQARGVSLKYRDARYHRRGRGFLGFGERIQIDADTAAGVAEFYDNITYLPDRDTFPYAGQVVRSWAWTTEKGSWLDPGRVEISFTEKSLIHEDNNAGHTYFTMPAVVHTMREEGTMAPAPGRSVLRFVAAAAKTPLSVFGESWDSVVAHDEHGHALIEMHQIDGADLDTVVTRGYSADTDRWQLDLLGYEEVCSTAMGMTQCRTATAQHNAFGEVTYATAGDPDDPGTQVSSAFAHDVYGHVTHSSATDAFGHKRASCVSYDEHGIFPYATRNGLGHTTYRKFDPGLGVPTAEVDPNGLLTTWRHDGFGRITEEHRPDGTSTTTTPARAKDGGLTGTWWNVKVATKEDGGARSTVELDSFGRAVRSLTVAAAVEACGAAVCKPVLQTEAETRYDFLGRVAWEALPWMSGDTLTGKLRHTYEYDASGRMTKHTEPWGRVTSYLHAGNIDKTTDWLGTARIERDALGRPVKAVDRKGNATTTFYGPFGASWDVLRAGFEVTISEHDAYGRVIREVDPDRGETRMTYDGFGEARTIDDAAGRHYEMEYDTIGRMVRRVDADGETRWAYDTADHGIGALASVTGPWSAKQYTYNTRSQLAGIGLAFGGEVFTASFGYDSKGLLHRITYPQAPGVAPLVVIRDHDAYGNLVMVRDNAGGTPFWQLTGLDGAGRAVGESFASGVIARREYTPESGMVKRIQARRGLTRIQDLEYAYDLGLRMKSRADRLQVGLAGIRTELFTHDALDRLTCSRLVDMPAGQQGKVRAGPCGVSVSYGANGNILSKSDVGAYAYDPVQPHAVTAAGGSSFAYDAVGNQIERDGDTIAYTAFDLPLTITGGSGDTLATFQYDGDQRRIAKTTAEAETVYFEDLYERVKLAASAAPVHRYYVAAGSATLVISRSVGAAKDGVSYLHTEALGSTDVVTSGGGAVVQRRSYDAFGARRSASWGQAGSGGVAKGSHVGFTGHEDEEDLGVVNMRGRLYDPRVGRFLQVDPVVGDRLSAQSWNGYSYVRNSPLNFTDPSGFDEEMMGKMVGEDGITFATFPAATIEPIPTPAPTPAEPRLPAVQTKDAARDDVAGEAVAEAPAATALGGGEAPGFIERTSRSIGALLGGVGCGLVPGCGLAHQVGVETGALRRPTGGIGGTGFAWSIGVTLGGAALGAGGAGGEIAGGLASATGFGALVGVPAMAVSAAAATAGAANAVAGVRGASQSLMSKGSGDEPTTLRPEAKYLSSGKHGIHWKEGPSLAKGLNKSQGQWGSVNDLEYAGKKAATLAPRQSGWFDLPEGHTSVVHRPDGTTVAARRFFVKNNGTGTFHGYPAE